AGVGLDGGAPLPRSARATAGHGGAVRGGARRPRDARLGDRRRPGVGPAGRAVNGAHDLGGMHGLRPLAIEPAEPVFHAEWERRTFALTLAMGVWRKWNLDMSRFAREQMPAAEYLATSYYEHWLWGLERLLDEHGFLARGDAGRRMREGVAAGSPVS